MHHLTSSLIRTNHQKIFKNQQNGSFKFQGYLFFGSNGWYTDETYEAEVRAVVEQ